MKQRPSVRGTLFRAFELVYASKHGVRMQWALVRHGDSHHDCAEETRADDHDHLSRLAKTELIVRDMFIFMLRLW